MAREITYKRSTEPGVLIADLGYRDQGGVRVAITRSVDGPGFVVFAPYWAFGVSQGAERVEAAQDFLDSWQGLRGPHRTQRDAKRELADAWRHFKNPDKLL